MIKVPGWEDARVEVSRRGGEGRGKRLKRGGRVLAFVVLVMLPSFSGLTWLGQVCAAEQAVDF